MIKKEINIFFTGLMFYTRLPVPTSTGFSEENLNQATRYFPLIGILVGAVGAGLFWLGNQLLPLSLAVVASMVGTILLTGAFHEDGFCDFCDGFGGGYGKEHVLAIMKDSRVGTYGTIGLLFMLLSKFFALSAMPPEQIPVVLVTAHAISRLSPVFLLYTSSHVGHQDTSKSKPVGKKSSLFSLAMATVFGLAPLCLLFQWKYMPLVLVAEILLLFFFRRYVHKIIGGYTGDVLGALQQLSELCYLLVLLVLFTHVP